MLGIILKEYFGFIRGIKSMFLVAFITFVSIWAARFTSNNSFFQSEVGGSENSALAGLSFILVILGALFVYILSHDIVNRDIELQRIRLLITKTSRKNIIIGKFLSIWFFWLSVTLVSFVAISILTNTFLIKELVLLWLFLAFHSSVSVMISSLIVNHSFTVIISLFLGLAMPVAGIWSAFNTSNAAQILRYGLPYYPLIESNFSLVISALEVIVMLTVSVIIMERREL